MKELYVEPAEYFTEEMKAALEGKKTEKVVEEEKTWFEPYYFKYDKHQGEAHSWIIVTSFGYEPKEERFYLSDGDWDGGSGDLDQWVHVSFKNAKELINLLTSMFPDWEQHVLCEKAADYVSTISEDEIKQVFLLLDIYCSENGNSMEDFKKLLEKEGIQFEYSAYRSSSDW